MTIDCRPRSSQSQSPKSLAHRCTIFLCHLDLEIKMTIHRSSVGHLTIKSLSSCVGPNFKILLLLCRIGVVPTPPHLPPADSVIIFSITIIFTIFTKLYSAGDKYELWWYPVRLRGRLDRSIFHHILGNPSLCSTTPPFFIRHRLLYSAAEMPKNAYFSRWPMHKEYLSHSAVPLSDLLLPKVAIMAVGRWSPN